MWKKQVKLVVSEGCHNYTIRSNALWVIHAHGCLVLLYHYLFAMFREPQCKRLNLHKTAQKQNSHAI